MGARQFQDAERAFLITLFTCRFINAKVVPQHIRAQFLVKVVNMTEKICMTLTSTSTE